MTATDAKPLRNTAATREAAKAALIANRQIDMLRVCPGPRGADTERDGLRRLGRHRYWYIGEFQHQPGRSGPVQCPEVPTFRTEGAAASFLKDVVETAG
jgi:hypothetical protein